MQVIPSVESNWDKQGKKSVITYFPCLYQLLQAETHNVTNRNIVHLLMESMKTI